MIDLKKKLKNRELVIGSWLQLNSPDVAEILAKWFEWLVIDMEHGAISIGDLPDMLRAVESGGAYPLVRLSENNPFLIKRVLDAGARGIVVPMIKTALEAQNAVKAAKYPPEGGRGIGYSRANNYGVNFKEYFGSFNREVVIIIQIEAIEAVRNIDSIFSVKGIDAFIIGPYDLSGSMNKTGKFNSHEFVRAVKTVYASAEKNKITAGIHVIPPSPEEVKSRISEGFKFIAVSTDAFMAINMAQNILKEIGRK